MANILRKIRRAVDRLVDSAFFDGFASVIDLGGSVSCRRRPRRTSLIRSATITERSWNQVGDSLRKALGQEQQPPRG